MSDFEFAVPCLFGLEGLAGDELRRMNIENVRVSTVPPEKKKSFRRQNATSFFLPVTYTVTACFQEGGNIMGFGNVPAEDLDDWLFRDEEYYPSDR